MTPPPPKGEILALTGIRALAALWVVGFHFCSILTLLFPAISGFLNICFKAGYLGVDLFFLLSGFIIAYNYQDNLYPFRWLAYKDFLWARLARLYPVHLVTLLLCLGLYVGAWLTNAHLNTAATNWGFRDFIANIFMVHAWTSHAHMTWNFPSWSISCEWLAYLCFPLIAIILAAKWNRLSLWIAVTVLLVGYVCLNLAHWSGLSWMFMGIAFEFPAGAILCRIYRLTSANSNPVWWPLQPLILGAIALTMVACAELNFHATWLIPLLALMLYALAIDSHGLLSRILACRPFRYWGRVSYSFYMTHAITSMVMVRLLPLSTYADRPLWFRIGACGLYFTALCVVAQLMYHAVEEPARRRLRHLCQANVQR